jgi:Cd2+/Zn2+-exporting ATPase
MDTRFHAQCRSNQNQTARCCLEPADARKSDGSEIEHGEEVSHDPAQKASLLPQADRLAMGATRSVLYIAQMDCPTEASLLRAALARRDDVQGLSFNLMRRTLTVDHAPDALAAIEQVVRKLGMTPQRSPAAIAPPAITTIAWRRLALAFAAGAGAEAAHWGGAPEVVSFLLALLAIASCGLGTYKKGWIALRHGRFTIHALMSIAVTGALVLRQWPEAAMVMTLFMLAEAIEARSLDRARNAIAGLVRLTPEQVTVRQADGSWGVQAVQQVVVGALIRVRPGERIGLDGEVTTGQSTVDQASITGESVPVDKAAGDGVYAGTINGAGELTCRVTAAAGASTLARIVAAVEAAQAGRAPTQRFVDAFARIYTPSVMGIALLVATIAPVFLGQPWQPWLYKALVLLVIACPCALVISTPVTVVSGLAAAARRGILIKGGVYLEMGRKLTWLALDKTGTLTEGKPRQVAMAVATPAGIPPTAQDAPDIMAQAVATSGPARTSAHATDNRLPMQQLALALADRSDHPVSVAIAQAARADGLITPAVEDFAALPGQGIRGRVAGRALWLGSPALAASLGHAEDPESRAWEQAGRTVVLLLDQQGVLARFAVADTLKPSSRQAIVQLHALGVQTAMLTGDNMHTAHAIGQAAGIDAVYGGQLPADKLAIVERYAQHGTVGMVGDGINDAPALARADIGFAMGALGADAAIETADVALMDDDLRKVAVFIRFSRATHQILIQNIALALGIKLVFLVLAIVGLGTMWMAVFADMGASLLVVANGLRLLRARV